jgi:hypothetical protein
VLSLVLGLGTLAAGLSGLHPTAAAALGPVDRIVVRRAASPLPLDPALTDARWADAVFDGPLVDLGNRSTAAVRTRVAVYYDDRAIYVGVRAQQTTPIVATQQADEVGFGTDDFVALELDAIGNGERLYLFVVTPRGTRYSFARESARYKPDWRAAATATPDGWNAVLQIPYRALKLAGNGTQRWRINIVRNVAATAQHQTLAYTPLMTDGVIPSWPSYTYDWRFWPTVSGVSLDGAVARPRPRAELYGLESAGSNHDAIVTPSGETVQRAPRNAGVDVAVPLDATTSFVGAFSPDFSNVEVDQQTIAPQQFQRALTEYRPFFAQGAPYVNAALQGYQPNLPTELLFYSPKIAAFDRGFKVAGSEGTTSFGALEVSGTDPQTGAPFDDFAFGVHQRRTTNTFAWWVDGAVAADGAGVDRSWEAGAYGRSLASGLVYSAMHAQETGSFTEHPGDAQKNAGWIDLQRPGMEALLGWLQTGPEFDPVAGFTNIADVRGPDFSLDLTRASKTGPFKNGELYLNFDRWLDSQGNVHSSDADAYLTLRTRSRFAFYANDQLGSLRTYEGDPYSGAPYGYRDQALLPYKTWDVGIGYGEGTPNSIRTDWQQGPFGTFFLQQRSTTLSRTLGRVSLSIDYDGSNERSAVGSSDGQWLRRYAVALPLGPEANATLAYRDVSGRGGFALPGRNLAGSLHRRFANGNELFVNYGTPAADRTLDRWIVKYLMRVGGAL